MEWLETGDYVKTCFTLVKLFDLVNNAASELFPLANSVNAINNTRGHMYKLFTHHNRVDSRKYFFSEQIGRVDVKQSTKRANTFQ